MPKTKMHTWSQKRQPIHTNTHAYTETHTHRHTLTKHTNYKVNHSSKHFMVSIKLLQNTLNNSWRKFGGKLLRRSFHLPLLSPYLQQPQLVKPGWQFCRQCKSIDLECWGHPESNRISAEMTFISYLYFSKKLRVCVCVCANLRVCVC